MQKRSILFSALLIIALLLAACSSTGGEDNQPEGTIFPTDGVVPNTGETPSATGEVTGVVDLTPVASETPAGVDTTTVAETPDGSGTPTAEVTGTVSSEPDATLAATGTPGESAGEAGGGTGVIGLPQTGRGLVGLAAMNGFTVVDRSGAAIGTVRDYIINTCESNILYMVVEPQGVANASGGQILVPYQATLATPNNGGVDAAQKQFVVNVNASDLNSLPTVDVDTLDFQNPGWEAQQLSFWDSRMSISLTTGCNVPTRNNRGGNQGAGQGQGKNQQSVTLTPTTGVDQGTPPAQETPEAQATVENTPQATDAVQATGTAEPGEPTGRQVIYRIGLASKILSADLRDGNGNPLGTVVDAAVIPETGRLQYLIVQVSGSEQAISRMVALPLATVNIQYETGTAEPSFVLLVPTDVYQNAPDYRVGNPNASDWFGYWQQYVPLTKDQLR